MGRENARAVIERAKKSAAAAGLRYVCDDQPGIRRVMGPLGFRYLDTNGRTIRAAQALKRIASLAVPPAWTDVWICADVRGHLQATGRDARGRKQYRYHPDFRACRDQAKYDRMLSFAAALPRIRARTAAHLQRRGLPREKVLAAVVQLLERSLIRVGNDEYARHNRSFGLTTLRDGHVTVKRATLRFSFRGKSGVRHTVDVSDRRLARIVRECRDLPGRELFQYVDAGGRRQDVTSADVNAYLREVSGDDFTAKDFRTWAGTVLAAKALREADTSSSMTQAKKQVVKVVEAVAGVLGNTRSVCRKSYIHPRVIDAYMDGSLGRSAGASGRPRSAQREPAGLRQDEMVVVGLLKALGRRSRQAVAA